MNKTNIFSWLLCVLMACAIAACSTSKNAGKANSTQTAEARTETPAPKPSSSSANSSQQSENIAGTPVSRAAASLSPSSVLAGMLNGEWYIVEAGKFKISRDDEMPYVNFSETDGKFYANNGCNVLNGNFLFEGQDQIVFSNVISTQMYCPDIKYDMVINSMLKDGISATARLERKENVEFLYLTNKGGAVTMTLKKHNLEAINGLWKFSAIDGQKVNVDGIDIFFDVAELTVHGNTGCNYFNGGISIDPQKINAISFSEMAVTMRMCENSDVERQMLVALEEAATYAIDGNTLCLYNDRGKEVAKLVR
ncbi:MAG: META domain-containing protein [Clostridium sp.]|nr:META domain-containing protein [Clostridium sp.]